MKRVVTNREIAILHYFNKKGWDELAERYFSYLITPHLEELVKQHQIVMDDMLTFGRAQYPTIYNHPLTPDEAYDNTAV